MILARTLLVGVPLWWIATGIQDTRVIMARGGPFIWVGAWLWLVLVLVGPAGRSVRPTGDRWRDAAGAAWRGALRAALFAAPLVIALGLVFSEIDVGHGPAATWAFGVFLVGLAVILSVAPFLCPTAVLDRFTVLSCPGGRPRGSSASVIAALTPLLVPIVAVVLLRELPGARHLEATIVAEGQAGVLYLTLLPFTLPAALLVAYGLDRRDGSRGSRPARVLLLVCTASFLGAAAFAPALIAALHVGERASTFSWLTNLVSGWPYVSSLRFWGSFEQYAGGSKILLPFDDLWRLAPLMLLAAAALSAWSLSRLGRGGPAALRPWMAGVAFAVQAALTDALVPSLGPAGAPAAGLVALALLALGAVLRRRFAAPCGEGEAVERQGVQRAPGDGHRRRAPAHPG